MSRPIHPIRFVRVECQRLSSIFLDSIKVFVDVMLLLGFGALLQRQRPKGIPTVFGCVLSSASIAFSYRSMSSCRNLVFSRIVDDISTQI